MSDRVRLRYRGRCPRIVHTPLPYVSRSSQTGVVTMDPDGEFDADDAKWLLENGGGLFAPVVADSPPAADHSRGPFVNKGLATKQRNKFFPGHVIQQCVGGYEIVDPSPAPPEGSTETPSPAEPEGLEESSHE